MEIEISVITPVYNASVFLEKAVRSALQFSNVREIVLVEDGSSDNSLELCFQLSEQDSRVKVFTHEGNTNKGPGISRNLGIQMATCPFITFLDADDYYLSNRFDADIKILSENPEVDGVYGAMGFHYYSESAAEKSLKSSVREKNLTTVNESFPPEILKWILAGVVSNSGHFHIATLTVKKELVTQAGLYPELRMHEDTIFLIKLAHFGTLQAGIIDEAIAMRGVHENNHITKNPNFNRSRTVMYKSLHDWAVQQRLPKTEIKFYLAKATTFTILDRNATTGFFLLLKSLLTNRIFRNYSSHFNPSVQRVFGDKLGGVIIKYKEHFQVKIFRSNSSSEALLQLLKTKSKK